jgi:hypothetical protein
MAAILVAASALVAALAMRESTVAAG